MMNVQVDEDTLADWKDAFDHFDAQDPKTPGNLDQATAQAAFLSVGRDFPTHEIANLLRDGWMDFQTFQNALMGKQKPKANPNEIATSLAVFDKQGNGQLSVPELRFAMAQMGERFSEQDVEEMTIEADPNGTGFVDYRAFAQILCQE